MTSSAEPLGERAPGHGPLTPEIYRVVDRRDEASDVVTLWLEPEVPREIHFSPGQFNMLTALGVGEVAISIAGAPGALEHSIRDVGAVTHALCSAALGSVIGVRGPFGTGWGVEDVGQDDDVVVVAGGIGLAPLRGAVRRLIDDRPTGRGRVFVLVGGRTPDQILFRADLESWRRAGAYVAVTVDLGTGGWEGHVGVVTTLLADAPFDPARTVSMLCGPEIMMRFTARDLVERGVDPERILVSLERNMQCGLALCGHCQLGPLIVCRDGPVVRYGGLADQLMMERSR